ncbi:Por secretion system C-terminal sorting domain-containing protein [Mariniphaga anaerophila]|uniref:Por secretion system C-terminal sorting domain-containing protein n=1 Tax=Mariniphaga anaerophila TaxID=1484053 RepID=A0A1M4TNY6_9BACT|nr:DUF5074 domain-containing protein [Mariniphaga anaerophila]SHE46105.1 Por secretion system C-terminal sorting domain-containing protein [Mariniphaga anaerophila]
MKKLLIFIVFWSVFFPATAQTTQYTDGVFILNEDWFGHNNSTINFLNPKTEEFDYLVFQENADNAGISLGCTAQFGTIYGGNLYVISKQDQDSGETNPVSGGRIIVADAKTLRVKKRIPVIFEINGKSAADGRSFVGVTKSKGYVGTSNGIYVFNLTTFEIGKRISGTANPLITGGESNADGVGPLYNNQIGMMCRTSDYVFAIQQDKGVLVIDPESDTVIKVIEGCFSTLTQSKDGTIWVGKNSNASSQKYPYGTVGEQWNGNQLLKINPNTLETEIISMSGGAGINQSWYAWTAGSLCASAKENVLYFTYNESKWNWFTTSKMYRYNIDSNEFTLIYDSDDEGRYFYGASIRINPLDDKIYAALYLDNINQSYFIYQLDDGGNLLKTFEPIKRYWFPAMFIFPDNHAPAVSQFSQVTLDNTQPVAINLENMASDQDNLSAAIVKSIVANDNTNVVSATIKNNELTLTAKAQQSGTAHITVQFNSNGKTVNRVQEVVVSTISASDETAPTAPSDLVAEPAETTITLSWAASTDNVGVTGYTVYVNGILQGTTTETVYALTGLEAATEYQISVEAIDAAGNSSEKATVVVSTSATPDETAPTTPVDLVAEPEETSISVSWGASTDNVGVTGYNVYVNDILQGTITETVYALTGLEAATEYQISVEATDAAGNSSETATVVVSTSAAPDETAPTTPSDLVAEPSETTISLSWAASIDNVGVTGYNVYVNDILQGTTTETVYALTGLEAATEYQISVEAIDAAGNSSEKATVVVSTSAAPDETAPTTPVDLVAEPEETSISVSWTASTDNVGVTGYNVYVNDILQGITTETVYALTGLEAATEYQISVEAIDAAGNSSEKATITQSTTVSTAISSVENKNDVVIYPNPFLSSISIKTATDCDAVIYDVSGKAVLQFQLKTGVNHVDTSELENGVYILRCGMNSFKIVRHD